MQGDDFPRPCLAPESQGSAAPWRDGFHDELPTIQSRDLIPLSEALVSRDAKHLRWLEFGVEQLADLARVKEEIRIASVTRVMVEESKTPTTPPMARRGRRC